MWRGMQAALLLVSGALEGTSRLYQTGSGVYPSRPLPSPARSHSPNAILQHVMHIQSHTALTTSPASC